MSQYYQKFEVSQLAFFINLKQAATLTGRLRPAIDL